MNLLYPSFTFREFRWMLAFGLVGSMVAGCYGVLHDQITYTIGPEYFTRFKFDQFFYLSREQPLRLIVAEIGFLATWWVGLFAGWFLGRITVPHEPLRIAARRTFQGLLIILVTAFVFGCTAGFIEPTPIDDPTMAGWKLILSSFRVQDTAAWLRVGNIHNAGYLGGLVGLISALIFVYRKRPKVTHR
jgi:hypothetical protein